MLNSRKKYPSGARKLNEAFFEEILSVENGEE